MYLHVYKDNFVAPHDVICTSSNIASHYIVCSMYYTCTGISSSTCLHLYMHVSLGGVIIPWHTIIASSTYYIFTLCTYRLMQSKTIYIQTK